MSKKDIGENVSEKVIENAEEIDEDEEGDNIVDVDVKGRKEDIIKYVSKDVNDIVGVTE